LIIAADHLQAALSTLLTHSVLRST